MKEVFLELMIIASLCTIPGRIDSILVVLNKLLEQTKKPDLLLISIAEFYPRSGKFYPKKDLDKLNSFLDNYPILSQIVKYELDIGPCRKLLTPLSNGIVKDNDYIIILDDDSPLRNDAIETLILNYQKNPNAVYGIMGVKDNVFIHAEHIPNSLEYYEVDVLGGYRGVLYHKFLLNGLVEYIKPIEETLKEANLIMMHDDHIFSYFLNSKNIKMRVVGSLTSSQIDYQPLSNNDGIFQDEKSKLCYELIKKTLNK